MESSPKQLNHLNSNLISCIFDYIDMDDIPMILNKKVFKAIINSKYSRSIGKKIVKIDLSQVKTIKKIDLSGNENIEYISCISHYETKLGIVLLLGFCLGLIQQYDGDSKKIISSNNKLFTHNISSLIQLKKDNDEILLAGTSDQPSFIIFDEKYNIFKKIEIDTNIYYLEILEETNILLISTFSRVEFYSYLSDTYLESIHGHGNYIYRTIQLRDFNPNYLATCSYDKTVKLWNIEKRSEIKTFSGHSDSVWWIEYLKEFNLEIIASCSTDNTLRLWNINSLQCVKVIKMILPNIVFLYQKSFFLKNQFILATRGLELFQISDDYNVNSLEKIISELEQISFSYLVLKQNEALIFISNYGGELIFFQINF